MHSLKRSPEKSYKSFVGKIQQRRKKTWKKHSKNSDFRRSVFTLYSRNSEQISDDTPLLRQLDSRGHNKKVSVRNEVRSEMDFNHQTRKTSAKIVEKVQRFAHDN